MSASVLPPICPRRADVFFVWLLLSLHLELGVDGERSSPKVANPHQFAGRSCALERVLRLRGGGRDDGGRGWYRGSRGVSPAVGSEVGEQRAQNSISRAGKGKTTLRARARGSTTSMDFDPPPEKQAASSVEPAPRTSSDTSERPALEPSEKPAVMTMADRVRYGASPPPPEPRSPSPPLTLADIQKNYLEVPIRTKRESHRTEGGRHRGGKDQYTERRRRGSPGRVQWSRKPQGDVVHERKAVSNYSEIGKDTFEVWKEWRKEIQEKVNDQGKFMLSGPRRSSVALTNDSWAELTAPYLLRVAVLGGRLPKWEQRQNSAFLRWAEPVVSHLQRKLRHAKVCTNASSVSNVAYEAYEQFPALGERPVLEGRHAFRPVREGQYAAQRRERLRRSGRHKSDGESTSDAGSLGDGERDPPLENVTAKPWVDPQMLGGPTWRDIAYRGYYAALEREAKEQAEKEAKEQAEREAKAAEEERQERIRLKKREEKRKRKLKVLQKETKKDAGDKEVLVPLEHGASPDPFLDKSRATREASRDSLASRDDKEEERVQEMQDEQQTRNLKETPRGSMPASDDEHAGRYHEGHDDASSPAPVEMDETHMDETKGSDAADSCKSTPSKRSLSPPPIMLEEESPARPQRTGRKRVPGRSVLERMSPTPNMRTISCLLDEKGKQVEARESVSVPQGDAMKDDGAEGAGGVEMMSSMSMLEEQEEQEEGEGEGGAKRVVTKRVRPKWLSFGHAWLMILRREILKTESLFSPPVRSPVVISLPDCPLLPPAHHSCAGMRTLVIDLDETLIHTALDDGQNCWVTHKRPGAAQFLTSLAEHYEIVIFTAGMETYAGPIIDELDPRNVIAHRLFRGSCAILAGYGTEQRPIHVKDLVLLGRDLARTMIIDNSPESYFLQPENAVPIKPFFGDKDDRELEALEAFLLHIIRADVGDVRKMLQQCHERGRFRVRRDDMAEGLRSSSSNMGSRSVSSCRRVVPEHVLAEVADYHEERQKAASEMMMMMSKLEPQKTANKDASAKRDRKPTPQKNPQQGGKSPSGVRDSKESAPKGGTTSTPTKDNPVPINPSSHEDLNDDPRPVGKPSRALTHWGDFEEGLDGGLPGTVRGEMDTKMTFVQWLLTKKKDDTPIGRIVRSTYDDIRGLETKLGDGIPGDSAKLHRRTYRALRKRMETLGSPDHILRVCDQAYEMYLREMPEVHAKF